MMLHSNERGVSTEMARVALKDVSFLSRLRWQTHYAESILGTIFRENMVRHAKIERDKMLCFQKTYHVFQ